ncbi:3-hydroxyacyl-CoA dehydrogenase [Acinetobacter towneri]|jgi:NAD(P)-dependent dehydrogenase (short-subunit alcohol dehydrogenase family)|uniref:3-hydroxyacyl-CoA dehydrogenase n=1 Tax=Acinetobacter towneri TaxID=202956 RepID=UPI001CE21186|nr:3-hydroxyacyl-CoA dehydrogenase [Acinetobacter towneri]MCA4779305.1 3-hydroxyacyl-CoA dehydrogenase [Acinetobacter towneri]MCA4784602.1 3-hydroxyacyl-CoA dehydrogenase [Acinetobacter towneri]MCA4787406.1 3-hydroxyacyl-CoA dehydrogenase [Acinetobacter towneri]MCA4795822.1 3-hydroxyacyl-CoA dehydrogenase [Acinetobacter towneri]MCA4800834.1 3-hydroxyacyl-CoA dehydrogenase [Acinetobacter towneri]
MKIQGKVCVVTGGASGLGAATAQHLVAQGAKVILVDMNQELGQQLQQQLGENAEFVAVDVTDENQVQQLFNHIEQKYGQLNGLVNCAGIAPSAKVLGRDGLHDLAMFQKVLNINVTGSFNMIRFAAQLMVKYDLAANEEERGVIVNTASVAAFDGQIGQSAYSASKGAIVGMTLPLARELAREAIRVMTIAPGIMETPMLKAFPQHVQDALGQMVPFPPRLAKPEEFAQLVGHIFENGYLNGEVIRLDGAIRMQPK